MNITFDDMSFPFVMDLLRAKRSAQGRGDIKAIENLKQNYPWLFSEAFKVFVRHLESVIEDIESRHGENISGLLMIDTIKNAHNLH